MGARRNHRHGFLGDRLLAARRSDLPTVGLEDDFAGYGQDVALGEARPRGFQNERR